MTPDTGAEGARLLAERWRTHIAVLTLPHSFSDTADHVTISVGYASLKPEQDQSPLELLELADKILYQAKEQGRNRVCDSIT